MIQFTCLYEFAIHYETTHQNSFVTGGVAPVERAAFEQIQTSSHGDGYVSELSLRS